MNKLTVFAGVVTLWLATSGFDSCGGPPPPPPVGFQIHTLSEVNIFGTLQDSPGIQVIGDYQHDVPAPPQGFITHFNQTTDSSGFTAVPSGKAPGVWNLAEVNGPCGGQATWATIGAGATQDLDCIAIWFNFSIAPNPIDVMAPPATITIAGNGLTTTYGMPQVQFFNSAGTIVGQSTATSVTNGGQTLTAPMPSLGTLNTATYGIKILNVQSGGSLVTAGLLPVQIDGREPRDGGGGGDHCGHVCK